MNSLNRKRCFLLQMIEKAWDKMTDFIGYLESLFIKEKSKFAVAEKVAKRPKR